MKVLTVIPARAGSKGLPGKNTRVIAGKPLLAWSIEQALACGYSSKVIVSTDCPETARLATQFGAEVPFLRPDNLATDITPTIDVLVDVLDRLRAEGSSFDALLLLEPTSPLREVSDLIEARQQLLQQPAFRSIVSIAAVGSAHPNFVVRRDSQGLLSSFQDQFSSSRRQDVEALYYFDGSLYLSFVEDLRRERSFYHQRTLGYEIARWKAFEIDDLTDFLMIEVLMRARQAGHFNDLRTPA